MKSYKRKKIPNADRRRFPRRRRGIVVLEFVLCIVILAFILMLIYFFGWSMMNQQEVKASARYTAWRNIRGTLITHNTDLNQFFFNQQATGVGIEVATGPDTTLQEYATQAGSVSSGAGQLAQNMFVNQFPRGSQATVVSRFQANARWDQFLGNIQCAHIRDGVEWRTGQADSLSAIDIVFLQPLDSLFQATPSLGPMAQGLYQSPWYRWNVP